MAGRKLDDYKPIKFYAENTTAKSAGFSKFESDGSHYFCRYVDGDIAMLSQAYSGKAGRDNGIESVKKNEKVSSRYKFETREGGKHGFALMAGNGQEIAVSSNFKTAAAAERVAGRLTGRVKAKSKAKIATTKPAAKKTTTKKSAKTPTAKAAAFTRADQRIENYKPLAFYEKHGGKAAGFNQFEEGGAYYFNYAEDSKVVLISESYTSKRGRDNGVASVTKNMKLKTAYEHHVHKTGKHYFDINAANRQEIATSRWYSSEKAALAGAATLRGESVKKTKTANVEQNYMPLAFYKKHTKGGKDGFESFKGEDGEHYFAYFENKKIALISEGYPTAAVRDKGLASVQKNMKTESRYVYGKGADGKPGFALRAGNNKEIARSVAYGSAAAAIAGAAYLLGTRRRAAAKPKTASKPKSKAKVAAPIAAAAVMGATAAAALPKGKVRVAKIGGASANTSGTKPKGTVPVKAAAIVAAPVAVAAIAAAAIAPKPAPTPEPVAVAPVVAAAAPVAVAPATSGGGIWGWLKWLLLAAAALLAMFLLFKACTGGEKTVKAAAPVETQSTALANVVTCWDGSKAKDDAACPIEPPAKTFTCWDGSKAVDQYACPVDPKIEAAKAAAAKAAAAKAAVLAAAQAAKPKPKATLASVTSGKMTAPSAAGRICGPSPNVLFNVDTATPVNVTYLGSNPQFGNSLTYTPQEFFQRLQVKYNTNSDDKSFLDLLAKSLGYAAFTDMDASMFSNDSLANGSSGLLGFGPQHALQYSTLNMSDVSNLEAFKVRSANGSDVHFMKRCGNFMYVCQP